MSIRYGWRAGCMATRSPSTSCSRLTTTRAGPRRSSSMATFTGSMSIRRNSSASMPPCSASTPCAAMSKPSWRRPARMPAAAAVYPDWVDDATVERSNRVLERLRATAQSRQAGLRRLAALPMHTVARIGNERVAVVHGDYASLAGWGFSQEVLLTAEGLAAADLAFDQA